MHLSQATDYSFRVLLHLATHDGELATVQQIAGTYDIPRSHLAKVVNRLAVAGFITTVRGRQGGMRLTMAPAHIRLGAVARTMESDFNVVECFDRANDRCLLSPACTLKHILHTATESYLHELDCTSLADLLAAAAPGNA